MFGPVFRDVYCNWQQDGRIPSAVNRGVVTLLRKEASNAVILENNRPKTLLNTESNILAKMLTKRLALVVDSLVGEAQNPEQIYIQQPPCDAMYHRESWDN